MAFSLLSWPVTCNITSEVKLQWATCVERIAQEATTQPVRAVAYMRTSSATNVGADKDSEKRQREAVLRFARRSGHEIVDEFYDAIDERPGFAAMLNRIAGNGVRASRDQSVRQVRALSPRSLAHRSISGAPILSVPSRCLICPGSAATPWKCSNVTRALSPGSTALARSF